MFCERCGGLLIPKKDDEGNTRMVCPACGEVGNADSFVVHRKIRHSSKDFSIIVEKDEETLPTQEILCPKCNNNIAYYFQVQTRSADEAMTTFYRCTKCNRTIDLLEANTTHL